MINILWRVAFDEPEKKYRSFFETWLRVCKNVSQSGRPVLLISSGGIPENVESCVERRYFSIVHYLALVCQDEALVERLQKRPTWRGCGSPAYIEEQLKFNRWFKQRESQEAPHIPLLDTTEASVEEVTEQVALWVREKTKRAD